MSPVDPRGANAYFETHVQSRTPLELVVMLYDGALRFMKEAGEAMQRRDLVAKRAAMSKALAIIGELQGSLNMTAGGEFAATLDRLYTYINTRLLDANIKGEVEPIEESIRLLAPMRDAWAQIATQQVPAVSGAR